MKLVERLTSTLVPETFRPNCRANVTKMFICGSYKPWIPTKLNVCKMFDITVPS